MVLQHARQQPRVRRRDAAGRGTGGVAERDIRCVLRRRLHSEGALITALVTIEHLSAGALENLGFFSSANRLLGALRDQDLGFSRMFAVQLGCRKSRRRVWQSVHGAAVEQARTLNAMAMSLAW